MNGSNLSYDEIRAALGFAARAGKLAVGDEACKKAIKLRRAKAIVLGEAAAVNTRERFTRLAGEAKLPLYIASCDIGPVIGRPGSVVAALMDEGFVIMIEKALQNRE